MFIELHMLQNFAPSNLNRDDTNKPKDCKIGGVRRARISSQCIKRAIRTSPLFAETTQVDLATRTRWLTRPLEERLAALQKPTDEIAPIVSAFVEAYSGKLDGDSKRTAVLIYLSQDEIDDLTQALLDNWDDLADVQARPALVAQMVKDQIKAHKSTTSAPDIALFGRMLADKPKLNLEAACQVAHAISTHRITMEMDFFTAVDDLQSEAEPGAGMMGFTGYDSACFYRYARIDWDQLVRNLDGDIPLARRTVQGFCRAAMQAVPSGKQNSFAAYNPPSVLLGVVRQDGMGWSLANAFERPVRPDREGGLVAPSVKALDAYWGRLTQVYGTDTLLCTAGLALDPDLPIETLGDSLVPTQEAWMDAVLEALPAEEDAP